MKRILVTGTARFYEKLPQRSARMDGIALAQNEFNLLTGNATGVDRWVAESFGAELIRREINPADKSDDLNRRSTLA